MKKMKNNQVTIPVKMIKENQRIKNKEAFIRKMKNIQKLKPFKVQIMAKKIKKHICNKMKKIRRKNLSQK